MMTTATWVELSARDVLVAGEFAQARLDTNRRQRRVDRWTPPPGKAYDVELVGVLCEMAVCRLLREQYVMAYLERPDDAPDVPPDWQVRGTRNPRNPLRHFPSNNPDHRFVLGIVHNDRAIRIAGWLYGYECRDPAWWDTTFPQPRWAVPQSALRDWGDR